MPLIPIPYPFINGTRHEFASVELKIGAFPFFVAALNFKNPMKGTGLWLNHPQKMGETIGREEPEADIEMALAEAYNLVAALQQQTPGVGYKLIRFNMLATYGAFGLPMIQDQIIGCRIIDFEAAMASGDSKALTRKIPLSVMRIKNFGQESLTNPLPGS